MLISFLNNVDNDIQLILAFKKFRNYHPVCATGTCCTFTLFCQMMQVNTKDKRMIILYAVPISRWPTLGKENLYFYTRQPNNNDPSIKEALP